MNRSGKKTFRVDAIRYRQLHRSGKHMSVPKKVVGTLSFNTKRLEFFSIVRASR